MPDSVKLDDVFGCVVCKFINLANMSKTAKHCKLQNISDIILKQRAEETEGLKNWSFMKNEDKSHKIRSNCEQVRHKYNHKVSKY